MTAQGDMTARNENLRISLQGDYGPIVGGKSLVKLLGFANGQAFRQAYFRRTLPIDVFDIPHRRGKFAFTQDIERWLSELKKGAVMPR
jgi:hypothetical protein